MSQHNKSSNGHQGDRFVWVAYSDLSTMLMLCFILIFIVMTIKSTALKAEVQEIKSRKEEILSKLEEVVKYVRKSPECKDTLWHVDRERNSVQVYFENRTAKREWFRVGDDKLTPDGKRCVGLFAKRWLATIYLDPLKAEISQLIVEGHTDSQRIARSDCVDKDGSDKMNFLCNLELSQQRSLNTVRVIFEDVTQDRFVGNPIHDNWADFETWRKQRLTATGRSFAEPVLSKDPSSRALREDMDRSRRVEFRFAMHGLIDRKTASNEHD